MQLEVITPSFRLIIVDDPSTIDQASLIFVPTRRFDYQLMVKEAKEKGFYMCVARIINVFKHLLNTLSVVDATILCPLPPSLANVFGNLETASVNSLDVEYLVARLKESHKKEGHINILSALEAIAGESTLEGSDARAIQNVKTRALGQSPGADSNIGAGAQSSVATNEPFGTPDVRVTLSDMLEARSVGLPAGVFETREQGRRQLLLLLQPEDDDACAMALAKDRTAG
ncbi:hypothetical protein GOP47_0027213 [Adiantum capillus-veneris]|nr:hypothetical protein GOP47_0027213 [Adiantum capillus-veneris]